jgi:uncharacterized protein YecE (DUF72 family)
MWVFMCVRCPAAHVEKRGFDGGSRGERVCRLPRATVVARWAERTPADFRFAVREHGAALVVADRAPKRPTPWVDTTDWSYLRLHNGRARGGCYGRHALRGLAGRIDRARGDVYAYFNNDWRGFAVENARTLSRYRYVSAGRRANGS